MDTDRLKGKRGRKGGTKFPRFGLKVITDVLDKFLGKTHTAPINMEQLNAGVFGHSASSPTGKTKFAAMKQFGLAKGNYSELTSTELSTTIAMSDGDTKVKALQTALLNVDVFKNVLRTYQNSTTEVNKIAQYAVQTLKVHPDVKQDFANVFIESCEIAELCSKDGESISFKQVPTEVVVDESSDSPSNDVTETLDKDDNSSVENKENEEDAKGMGQGKHSFSNQGHGKSNINVNIDVDPSMDPEKLEKLLKLLKNYGAI